jgi:hypothetical protein
MDDVIKFFEHYHPSQAKIFNLCIEDDRQYEVENFSGQVASFPFYDHNCPPLALIPAFCNSAYTWLNEGPDHVIAVHCKAGKSRTGVMVCCLLLHIKEQRELDECIRFYGFQRCYDGKGVTIPCRSSARCALLACSFLTSRPRLRTRREEAHFSLPSWTTTRLAMDQTFTRAGLAWVG